MRYVGKHFRDQRVTLDGHAFEECRFTNVLFQYSGGPVTLNGCAFEGFGWELGGDLGRGLSMLGALYAGQQSAGLSLIVNTMFPKPEQAAEPAPLHPSLVALFEAEARDADADADAKDSEPFDYGRLQSAIRRTPDVPRAAGFC